MDAAEAKEFRRLSMVVEAEERKERLSYNFAMTADPTAEESEEEEMYIPQWVLDTIMQYRIAT